MMIMRMISDDDDDDDNERDEIGNWIVTTSVSIQ